MTVGLATAKLSACPSNVEVQRNGFGELVEVDEELER